MTLNWPFRTVASSLKATYKKINRINVVHLKWGSREAACEGPCTRQRLMGLSRSELHCVLFIFTLFNVGLSDIHNSLKQARSGELSLSALSALWSVLQGKRKV